MTKSFVQMASLPDRENLVAEAWSDGKQICEVSYENGTFSCLIFSSKAVSEDEQDLIEKAVSRMRLEYNVEENIMVNHILYKG